MRISEQFTRNSDQPVRFTEEFTRNSEKPLRNFKQLTRNSDQLVRNSEQFEKFWNFFYIELLLRYLMSSWLLIIFVIGLSVTLWEEPSRFLKSSFPICIRSSWAAVFSLALAVPCLLHTSLTICNDISIFQQGVKSWSEGAFSVTNIVIENEIGELSSNTGCGCLCFTSH